jgi:hypothetical protein
MAVWLCSSGGVQLSALNDKIWCDNTLDERATLAIRDLQPVIRYLLFPSCRSAPVTKPVVYACVQFAVGVSLGWTLCLLVSGAGFIHTLVTTKFVARFSSITVDGVRVSVCRVFPQKNQRGGF